MDRQTWLEARRKGIGGSDAAAILGLSRYRTAVDVYEDKVGIAPERPQTAAMAWGLRLEDAIALAYTETTGRRVWRTSGIRRAHHVKTFPMIASIDRLSEDRVVELKKKRSGDDLSEDGPPEKRVPVDWYVQTQHYLEVLERDVADVAVLVGGTDFRVIEIPRDREYGADLVAEEGAFWRDYVEAGVYPPATADDLANLGRRFGRSTDDEKVATPELAMLIDRYLGFDLEVDEAEYRRDKVKAEIMEAMGETGKLLAPAGTVTWRSHDRTTTSWKAYAEALELLVSNALANPNAYAGEVIEAILATKAADVDLEAIRAGYSATSSVRPFRVDRKKEESE